MVADDLKCNRFRFHALVGSKVSLTLYGLLVTVIYRLLGAFRESEHYLDKPGVQTQL